MPQQIRTPEQVDRDVWSRIDTTNTHGCWPWTGAVNRKNGFGQFYYLGKRGPHRWVMERQGHKIDGHEVRHKCMNPVCCNPNHLYLHKNPA